MSYEELLNEAANENLIVKEKDIPGYKGRIYKNRIAIRKDIPTMKEKACVLAEELGHYHTGVGNILSQGSVSDRKQELHGRIWGYNEMIGLSGLISAAKAGCRNMHEVAEHLDVAEEYLQEALIAYRSKYGLGKALDNYWITFEPNLQIYQMFEIAAEIF